MTITVLPRVDEAVHDRRAGADVGHVQAGRRLVHHVDAALLVQLAGELDALALAARERAERLAEREIVQPDVAHRLQLAHDLLCARRSSSACATVIASTSLIDLPFSL